MLGNNGAFMVKDAMNLFKDKILQQPGCSISDNDWESYWKTLGTHLEIRGYKSYFLARKWESMYYKPSAFSGKGVESLHNMMNENKPGPLTKEHIRTLIKQQVALFPKSLNFDYRQLFYDENGSKYNLTKYMNDKLMGFMDITKSNREVASRKVSELYAHSRKMKSWYVQY